MWNMWPGMEDSDSLMSMSLSMFEEDLFFGLPLEPLNEFFDDFDEDDLFDEDVEDVLEEMLAGETSLFAGDYTLGDLASAANNIGSSSSSPSNKDKKRKRKKSKSINNNNNTPIKSSGNDSPSCNSASAKSILSPSNANNVRTQKLLESRNMEMKRVSRMLFKKKKRTSRMGTSLLAKPSSPHVHRSSLVSALPAGNTSYINVGDNWNRKICSRNSPKSPQKSVTSTVVVDSSTNSRLPSVETSKEIVRRSMPTSFKESKCGREIDSLSTSSSFDTITTTPLTVFCPDDRSIDWPLMPVVEEEEVVTSCSNSRCSSPATSVGLLSPASTASSCLSSSSSSSSVDLNNNENGSRSTSSLLRKGVLLKSYSRLSRSPAHLSGMPSSLLSKKAPSAATTSTVVASSRNTYVSSYFYQDHDYCSC